MFGEEIRNNPLIKKEDYSYICIKNDLNPIIMTNTHTIQKI